MEIYKSNNILLISLLKVTSCKTVTQVRCNYAEMRKYYLRSKWLWSTIMAIGLFGIAPGRHSAHSAFRPPVVGIRARTHTVR